MLLFFIFEEYSIVGESNRIRTVPVYGHSRYIRNHKSYKKIVNEF